MDKKILITGSEGLVGSRFLEISSHKDKLHFPKLVEFDITNKEEVKAILESFELSAIVNFAAYTDVNAAENERGDKSGDVWRINMEGPGILAEAVALSGKDINFIQISTDMVFSGSTWNPGPYKENHKREEKLENLTWYGYTKSEGENVVQAALREKATILRLIYPVRAKFEGKLDYVRKPLSLFDEGKLYPLFNNQQISISFIDEVVETVDKLIDTNTRGIFHVSTEDTTTPFELIKYVLEKTGRDSSSLKSIKLEEYLKKSNSQENRYPKFGGLSVNETEDKLGAKFSSWKEVVDKMIEQGLGK